MQAWQVAYMRRWAQEPVEAWALNASQHGHIECHLPALSSPHERPLSTIFCEETRREIFRPILFPQGPGHTELKAEEQACGELLWRAVYAYTTKGSIDPSGNTAEPAERGRGAYTPRHSPHVCKGPSVHTHSPACTQQRARHSLIL